MAEQNWRPVPGFPDLEVSEDLQFRTKMRLVAYTRPSGTKSVRRFPSKKLKVQWVHHEGYATVFVSRLRRPIGCHVLVCLAWHGPPPEGKYYALHRDGDTANFSPENLYWGDHRDNANDADKHGTLARGEAHGIHKLTEEQVFVIRACSQTKLLAEKFGVSPTAIRHARHHRTWTHL